MKTIAWCLIIGLGALSLTCIVPNYILLWRGLRAKPGEKVPSVIPVVGGLLGFFAVRLFVMLKTWPHPRWSWYALLPPALDPGCFLIPLPIMLVVWTLRGAKRSG